MKVLLIIDMLNGFCRKGNPLSLPNTTVEIEKEIESRILIYTNNNYKYYFICDSHSLNDPEINNPYPPHCMQGTDETKIINTLSNYANKKNVLTKNTLSITYNTKLIKKLEELNPTQIEITGVCTEICVMFAVYELRIRGYNVIVNSKGVLPLKSDNHEFFLTYIQELLGAIVF
ncbi:MAG: cysteine hydrolase [Bacteroidetes bacterium]|nr:cysteine hydrolase [Bacteroidota bacterium]